MTYEDKIERRLDQLNRKAKSLADATALCANLEHARKAVIAVAMQTAQEKGHKTAAAQEREAYASAEYRRWLDGYTEAIREKERLRLEHEVMKIRFEYWRTSRADRRAEMALR